LYETNRRVSLPFRNHALRSLVAANTAAALEIKSLLLKLLLFIQKSLNLSGFITSDFRVKSLLDMNSDLKYLYYDLDIKEVSGADLRSNLLKLLLKEYEKLPMNLLCIQDYKLATPQASDLIEGIVSRDPGLTSEGSRYLFLDLINYEFTAYVTKCFRELNVDVLPMCLFRVELQ